MCAFFFSIVHLSQQQILGLFLCWQNMLLHNFSCSPHQHRVSNFFFFDGYLQQVSNMNLLSMIGFISLYQSPWITSPLPKCIQFSHKTKEAKYTPPILTILKQFPIIQKKGQKPQSYSLFPNMHPFPPSNSFSIHFQEIFKIFSLVPNSKPSFLNIVINPYFSKHTLSLPSNLLLIFQKFS